MTDRCAECERSALFVHTAQVNTERDQKLIAYLDAQVKALRKQIADYEKGVRRAR